MAADRPPERASSSLPADSSSSWAGSGSSACPISSPGCMRPGSATPWEWGSSCSASCSSCRPRERDGQARSSCCCSFSSPVRSRPTRSPRRRCTGACDPSWRSRWARPARVRRWTRRGIPDQHRPPRPPRGHRGLAIVHLRNLFAAVMLAGIYSLLTRQRLRGPRRGRRRVHRGIAVGAGIATILMLAALALTGREQSAATGASVAGLAVVLATGAALVWGTLDMPHFGDPLAPIQVHVAPRYLEARPSPRSGSPTRSPPCSRATAATTPSGRCSSSSPPGSARSRSLENRRGS